MGVSNITLTISSGNLYSDIANVRNSRGFMTLVANAMTSCQLFLQAGTQASSAALKRVDMMTTGVTSTWIWSVGSGGRAIGLPSTLVGPFLRIEASVAQTDNRSLSLIVGGL